MILGQESVYLHYVAPQTSRQVYRCCLLSVWGLSPCNHWVCLLADMALNRMPVPALPGKVVGLNCAGAAMLAGCPEVVSDEKPYVLSSQKTLLVKYCRFHTNHHDLYR